jgi:FMN-dependent NADH-azoreductase
MTRIVIATAVAMLLVAPLANAKVSTVTQQSVDHCRALQQQFEIGRQGHSTARKMAEAQTLYDQGTGLCNTSQQKQGIKTLKTGLEKIGVKTKGFAYTPVYKSY